jgi:protein-S-isoprenylcysteine O-methyltransferase Ste14
MNLQTVEHILRLAAGILAYLSLAVVFYGIWRGTWRPSGRTSGRAAGWLRSAVFYLIATAGFVGLSILGWKSIPMKPGPGIQLILLITGSLLYFPGMLFLLWARLVLGKMYFVSTSFGAQLYADHKLVTSGPFAVVRHPMYLGLVTAALGSLLLFQMWTTLAYALFAPFVLRRARREEAALAAEFGKKWQEYSQRVPSFLPWIKRMRQVKEEQENGF